MGKMKVLMKSKCHSLRLGDVATVNAGYARNYLLPKKLAVLATPSNLKELDDLVKERVRQEKIEREEFTALNESLKDVSIKFTVEVVKNDEKKLFGSVTRQDIAKELHAMGFHRVTADHINLPQALKTVGSHAIALNFPQVKGEISVEVIAKKANLDLDDLSKKDGSGSKGRKERPSRSKDAEYKG